MLMLQNVSVTFFKGTLNAHQALNTVSLHLVQGDFVTVVGSNGAGKSTLLNAICGGVPVDGGRILLGGEDITFLPDYKRARRIGRLFQDPMRGTAPDMTLAENLALAYARGARSPFSLGVRAKDIARFREALSAFHMGLEDRLHMKVGLLSGGQRQAMALLMATIASPSLLLLDEHTAALDPATAETVLRITQEIVRAQRLTTLMITHNLYSALSLGNRTVMMDAGRIVLDVSGKERESMTVDGLLSRYAQASGEAFGSDRALLSRSVS